MGFLPHDSPARESSNSGQREPGQEEQKISEEQFYQLYLEVWNVFRYPLLRTLSWAEDPEDVVGDGFERLLNIRHTLPADLTVQRMQALLVTICKNLAADRWRRQQRYPYTLLSVFRRDNEGDAQEGELADTDEDFVELIVNREFCQSILRRLSPDEAEILTLRFLVGLAPREIALELKLEPGCVSTRITRAKKEARRLIKASLHEC